METIYPVPQAATPLTTPSSVSQTPRRAKLPNDGQNIPSGYEYDEVEKPENKDGGAEGTREALQTTVDNLNQYAQSLKRNLQFSVDEESDRTVIRVVDSETKQVIRQIPSEEMLSIARRTETAVSAILDVQA